MVFYVCNWSIFCLTGCTSFSSHTLILPHSIGGGDAADFFSGCVRQHPLRILQGLFKLSCLVQHAVMLFFVLLVLDIVHNYLLPGLL